MASLEGRSCSDDRLHRIRTLWSRPLVRGLYLLWVNKVGLLLWFMFRWIQGARVCVPICCSCCTKTCLRLERCACLLTRCAGCGSGTRSVLWTVLGSGRFLALDPSLRSLTTQHRWISFGLLVAAPLTRCINSPAPYCLRSLKLKNS